MVSSFACRRSSSSRLAAGSCPAWKRWERGASDHQGTLLVMKQRKEEQRANVVSASPSRRAPVRGSACARPSRLDCRAGCAIASCSSVDWRARGARATWRKASRCLLAALALAAGMGGWSLPVPAQQQRWAAIDPNGEGSSAVVWGATEDEARQRAVEACKKVSKTCAGGPASTPDLREVFAVVCCTQPHRGCAVSAAANRREAAKNVQEMFADAGYKDCSVQHYMSAATGKRL